MAKSDHGKQAELDPKAFSDLLILEEALLVVLFILD